MVPAGWEHPKQADGRYFPLFDGACLDEAVRDWDEGATKWAEGFVSAAGGWRPRAAELCESYTDWAGERPSPDDYMPCWPESERTHFVMYEDTSEGTPISPAFATAEELARWLADNDASAFAGATASYEAWLATIQRGSAVSAVITSSAIVSGVEYQARPEG